VRREERTIGECRLDVRRFGAGAPAVGGARPFGVTFDVEFVESLGAHHEVFVPHHPGWVGFHLEGHGALRREVSASGERFMSPGSRITG
jgi:hypothetical protein